MGSLVNKLIVANTGSDSLTVVDLKTNCISDTIYLCTQINFDRCNKAVADGPNIGPHQVILGKDKKLYSVNSYNNSVYRINMCSKEIEEVVLVGSFPSHIQMFNGNIFVTNSDSNSISIIDEKEFHIIENIPVGEKPHDIKIDDFNNTIYVANNNGYSISVIDMNKSIEQNISLKYNPLHIYIIEKYMVILCPPSNGMLCSKILILDLIKNEVIKEIEIAGVIFDMTMSQDNKVIYVTNAEDGCIYVININYGRIISKHHIGGMPNNIVLHNGKIFVSDALENKLTIFDCCYDMIIDSINVGLEPSGLTIT